MRDPRGSGDRHRIEVAKATRNFFQKKIEFKTQLDNHFHTANLVVSDLVVNLVAN